MKKLFILPFILTAGLLLFGCEGTEGIQGVSGENPLMVNANIEKYPSYYSSNPNGIRSFISLYHSPSVAQVYLNDTPIPIGPYGEYIGSSLQYAHENLPFSQGDSVHLEIIYEQTDGDTAIAWADIVIPGEFEINNVDTNYMTVEFGEDLELSWTESYGADAYYCQVGIFYRYRSVSGDTVEFFWQDLEIHEGTSVVFDSADIYPGLAEVDSVLMFSGALFVNAISGPTQEGDDGNIQGEGIGFFASTVKNSSAEYYTNIILAGG